MQGFKYVPVVKKEKSLVMFCLMKTGLEIFCTIVFPSPCLDYITLLTANYTGCLMLSGLLVSSKALLRQLVKNARHHLCLDTSNFPFTKLLEKAT